MAFGLWILIHRLGNYNGYNHPICFPSSATIFYFLSLWGVHLSNTNKRIQGTRNSSPCPLPRAGQCLGSHLMGDSKPLLIVSPPTLYSPWMGFRGSDTLDKKVVWMWFTLLTLGKIVEPFIGFSGGPSISHSFTHYLLSIYNVARTRSSH